MEQEWTTLEPWTSDAFVSHLSVGDVVVSMLPASLHPKIARLCIEAGTHFVSTSYLSDEMRALDATARARGLTFMNEVGLDPGLDHMLAHLLVAELGSIGPCPRAVSLRSYCGGFPERVDAFKYRFSWSPVGVLRALKTPARWVSAGNTLSDTHPWRHVAALRLGSDTFDAYPNRDSMPYIAEYGFHPDWRVHDFVRGTLRPEGWAAAWREIFSVLESSNEDRLSELADDPLASTRLSRWRTRPRFLARGDRGAS